MVCMSVSSRGRKKQKPARSESTNNTLAATARLPKGCWPPSEEIDKHLRWACRKTTTGARGNPPSDKDIFNLLAGELPLTRSGRSIPYHMPPKGSRQMNSPVICYPYYNRPSKPAIRIVHVPFAPLCMHVVFDRCPPSDSADGKSPPKHSKGAQILLYAERLPLALGAQTPCKVT